MLTLPANLRIYLCARPSRAVAQRGRSTDQPKHLTAEIIAAAGKRAITGGLCIQDHLNWRFMCGDRGNSICDGVQTDEAGAYMTGPTAPYQRKMTTFGVCAGYGSADRPTAILSLGLHLSLLEPLVDRSQPDYIVPDRVLGAAVGGRHHAPVAVPDGQVHLKLEHAGSGWPKLELRP